MLIVVLYLTEKLRYFRVVNGGVFLNLGVFLESFNVY